MTYLIGEDEEGFWWFRECGKRKGDDRVGNSEYWDLEYGLVDLRSV
ncbi:hypothetical protein [Haloferula sp.]